MNNNRHLIHFMGHQVEEMRVLIMMARAHGNVKDLLMLNRLNRKQQQERNSIVLNPESSTSANGSSSGTNEVVLLSVECKLDIALQVSGFFTFSLS